MKSYLYDAAGRPYHAAGTRIHRDADGNLVYDCPHCGRHWVPSDQVRAMGKYALDATG
jgi:hypothetical protein